MDCLLEVIDVEETKEREKLFKESDDVYMDIVPLEIRKTESITAEESLSFVEMKNIISKVWLNVDDIMKLAQCGKHSATNIRNEIEEQIVASGKKLPTGIYKCVPTKLVLDYLGLDVDYIFTMAERFA